MATAVFRHTGETIRIGNIFCLGRNYAEHAKEMKAEVPKQPIIFLKPSSAVIPSGTDIVLPDVSNDVEHEVELVVLIGKGGRNIPEAQAPAHVAGYAVGLDMTMRDLQAEAKKKGLPWAVAKGFDTSAPLSDVVAAADVPDPRALRVRCSVNGVVRQETSAAAMIFSIPQMIAAISGIFTLGEGDLIFTGTPEGVGRVNDGDRIDAELVGYVATAHRVTRGRAR